MDPRFELRHALRTLRAAWPQEQADALGLAYRGPADFVLREGKWWRQIDPPAAYQRGLPKHCYGNSLTAAVLYGLRYVEGYGLSLEMGGLPVPHAWNADAAGNAIDLTWRGVRSVYLGVEFAVWRADDATWNGDANVLDDFNRDWPVLRERWRGERTDPPAEWEPSVSLRAAYAKLAGDEEEAFRLMELATELATTPSR